MCTTLWSMCSCCYSILNFFFFFASISTVTARLLFDLASCAMRWLRGVRESGLQGQCITSNGHMMMSRLMQVVRFHPIPTQIRFALLVYIGRHQPTSILNNSRLSSSHHSHDAIFVPLVFQSQTSLAAHQEAKVRSHYLLIILSQTWCALHAL